MRRMLVAAIVVALTVVGLASPSFAGQLPDNCTKDRGTVTCSSFDGPGKNQGGVGTTTTEETQGNTTNKSPEPPELESSESCNPPSSNGKPCNP